MQSKKNLTAYYTYNHFYEAINRQLCFRDAGGNSVGQLPHSSFFIFIYYYCFYKKLNFKKSEPILTALGLAPSRFR